MALPTDLSLFKLEDIRAERARRSLSYFVPHTSPEYMEPKHLAPLIECFEKALRGEPQYVVCHAPPRHSKTETTLHYIPWALKQKPELVFSYSTYGDRLSRSKSRKARMLAERAGVRLVSNSLNEWRTEEGGGLLAGGVGGPLVGYGVNIAIVDDPIKDRLQAESPAYRERLWDWFNDVLFSRIEPEGSCFVFMTRWHPDDLSGRLAKEGWRYICLPAVNENEEALWPERWPLEALAKKKARGAYTWASIYQGSPRPRGGSVFGEAHVYTELPKVYQAGFGLDLSYSAKTSSDYSVVVKMLKDGYGKKYVVDVIRRQVRAPKFKKVCRLLHRREPTAPWRWYGSGTEIGSADFFTEAPRGIPLEIVPAKGDKFIRAQHYAAEWNAGNILVPRSAPWLDDFLAEHASFTGVGDGEDDQVDAAVACNDVLDGGAMEDIETRPVVGRRGGLASLAM
jgi:predicted phage terminase large subunit-like protein